MPYPYAFAAGFRVKRGLMMDGFKLTTMQIGHKVISRFHHYEYPIHLVFEPDHEGDEKSSSSNLIRDFKDRVSGNRTVDSQAGNPYLCNFGTISAKVGSDGRVTMTSTGSATRIYKK